MYKRNIGRLGGLFLSLIIISPLSFAEVNPESIIQIFQRLEILEKKSRELTGENEVLKHQIEQLKKVQKQGFLNVDEQIDEMRQSLKEQTPTQAAATPKSTTAIETETVVAAATPVVKAEANTVVVKSDGVKTLPASSVETSTVEATDANQSKNRAPTDYEKETYQAAFNKMSASPTAATKAFQEYIQLQPKSPLAANAQYWIGEIKYSHNNYKGAVQEFIKVLQQYKNSSKAPDAAIKLGYSFYALKNWEYARRTFEDALKYFPDNKNAVSLATKRLEKMKSEGH